MHCHVSRSRRRTAINRASALLVAAAISLPAMAAAQEKVDVATIDRIKTEEMNNSHVMDIMSWLSDVYGPRLTWSPNAGRARDWAMLQLKSWGLSNVHAETWDTPVGLGWENERFSLMATAPVPFIVEAVPQAWSGSTNGPVSGPAVLVDVGCSTSSSSSMPESSRTRSSLTTPPRNQPVNSFVPTATRYADSTLARMEAAQPAAGGAAAAAVVEAALLPPRGRATCERQFARDSAAAAASGRGGRGGFGGGRGGLNVGDTSVVRAGWSRRARRRFSLATRRTSAGTSERTTAHPARRGPRESQPFTWRRSRTAASRACSRRRWR